MPKLTAKQRIFIAEYLQCHNAAEAARRAGYSRASARFIGHENLTKPYIREVVQQALEERGMSLEEVVARLSEQGRGDLRDFLVTDERGRLLDFDLGPDKPLHLLKKVTRTAQGVTIELHDAQQALALLAKHYRLFGERQAVTGTARDPLQVEPVNPKELTNEEPDTLIAQIQAQLAAGGEGA